MINTCKKSLAVGRDRRWMCGITHLIGCGVWLDMELNGDGSLQDDFQDCGLDNWVDSGTNAKEGTMVGEGICATC